MPMPIRVDPITHKKLILVKQLYQQAVVQSASQHSIVGRIMSVIGFDLAVETVLKAVVGSLEPSKVPSDGFQGLVQQAEALLVKASCNPVPDRANIQYVHSIRNDAQHKAKYPNESDVSDCRTYTRDFLRKIIADVWGLSFEEISLTDIVQHKKVKEFLVNAERALGQGDYQQAVEQAAAGLTFALGRVKTAVVGPTSHFVDSFVMGDGFGELASDIQGRDAYRAFVRMQETLLYVALGMNYADYMHYSRIAGEVYFAGSGEPVYQGMKEHIDTSDAEFVVAYCTDAVIQVESRVGSLDAPFGSDRWY